MPLSERELQDMPPLELLEVAIEEAAELIHAIQKFKTYGAVAFAPNGKQYDNAQTVMHEARQASDAMRIWCHRNGLDWSAAKHEIECQAQQELAEGVRPRRSDPVEAAPNKIVRLMMLRSAIELLEYEIANGTQRSVAVMYALNIGYFLGDAGKTALSRTNQAIRERWSMAGLERVKKMAWLIHDDMASEKSNIEGPKL